MYTSCRSLVVGYDCDGNLVLSHRCAERDERYSMVVVLPSQGRGGEALYIPGGVLVRDPSFSSPYVVLHFPSMLFSNLFTTSSLLPLLFLRLYLVIWHILFVIPVLGGEFSAHSCNSHRLSSVEVT